MSSGIYNRYTGYHNRRSIRLRGYNYSRPGYYFVTICIHDRKQKLFGSFDNGPVGAGSKPAPVFKPNQYAQTVQQTWHDLPNHISNIVLDEFIIMPNHVHGIIRISDHDINRAGLEDRAGLEPAPTVGLPEIVRQLKTFSARRINIRRNTPGQPVWQRNYYDHVIRDEKSLYFIRKYIRENPVNWSDDSESHIDREILESRSLLHSPNQPQ
jgi:REP element-mobilizing transposase RayT